MAGISRIVTGNAPKTGRVARYPQHTWQVRHKPWVIQPMCIAPVLPGETLKNMRWKSRAISEPISNRLLGWWLEYYWFYVKHRDLDERADFESMVLDPSWDRASVSSNTDVVAHYFEGGTTGNIDWVDKCLTRVVDTYFRDGDEVAGDFLVDSMPLAKVQGNSWMDSLAQEGDITFPDTDVDLNADDTITVGEIDEARRQYEFLKQEMGLPMTYEDFLATYGVRPKSVELHTPELIRFARQWTYPVSAIDPTDGSAASAVTWNTEERADKDRFFKEPGFILGVTVARPKVYFSGQKGYAASLLDDAYSWLPAVLTNDYRTSLKLVADNEGPLGDVTDANGYWVDVRDLFLYGDQFANFDLTTTGAGAVALPTAGLQKRYVASSDIDGLFPGTSKVINQDGIANFAILGRQMDQTPMS